MMVKEDSYLVRYSFMREGKIEIRHRDVSEVIKNRYVELYRDTLPTEREMNNLIEEIETKHQ
jgi:hypothetical protein